MKLIKTMLAGMVLLVFAVGQEQTDGGPPPPPPCDPNATYPVADPGPDGGCGNYNDCNGNGAYDLGEPCGDMPMNDPAWEAFSSTLENGGSPDDAFEAAAAAVYDMNVATGNATEEEFEEGKANARMAFDQALAEGKSPEEAFGDAMATAGAPTTGDYMEGDHDGMEGDHDGMEGDHDGMDHMGPAPTNHWDGNCGAMMSGQDEYWLDSDGDGTPEDGPYAVWYEDADGNPVNCGPMEGDHDGMEGDHDGMDHMGPPPFEDVDANGDGLIDREEARAVYGCCDEDGNENPNFDQEFDEVDSNGDGVVDPAEHMAAPQPGDDGPPPSCEEMDMNGDGVIDREEGRAKFGYFPDGNENPNFDADFDQVDTNGDGVVDCAEHNAAIEAENDDENNN